MTLGLEARVLVQLRDEGLQCPCGLGGSVNVPQSHSEELQSLARIFLSRRL